MDDLICDKDAVLGLSLSIRRHRLFIYQSTIKALGKPEYIKLLFNPNQNKFAIQSCDCYDKDCFVVPKNSNKAKLVFEITSLQLLNLIWKHCKWNKNKSYRIFGLLHTQYSLVEFNLSDSVVIDDSEYMSE